MKRSQIKSLCLPHAQKHLCHSGQTKNLQQRETPRDLQLRKCTRTRGISIREELASNFPHPSQKLTHRHSNTQVEKTMDKT